MDHAATEQDGMGKAGICEHEPWKGGRKEGRKEGKRPSHFGVALGYLGTIEQMRYGAYGVLWVWDG